MTYFVRHTVIYIVSLCLILWGIAEAVYGGLQLYGLAESNHSLYNITGSFRNPGPYAGFLAVVLPVALYLALSCRIRNKCLHQGTVTLCWVYVFLCATLLPATLSRAAWIAACVGCGIVLCARYRLRARCILYFRRHRRRAWAWLSAACLLLALAGVGAYYLKKDSADGRLLMWKVTARVVADAPYTGVGPGRFAGAYGEAQAVYFASGKGSAQEKHVAGSPEYAFNEFLGITAERGFPFLMYCLVLLVLAFRCAGRGRQWGIAGGLAAFLAFSCFSYPLSVWRTAAVAVVLLAAGGVPADRIRPAVPGRRVVSRRLRRAASASVVLAVAVGLVAGEVSLKDRRRERREAVSAWEASRQWSGMGLYDEALEELSPLYPAMRWNFRYLYDYGYALHKEGRFEEGIAVLSEGARISSDPMFHNIIGKCHEALGRYDAARDEYMTAHYMVPCRLYPLVLLMRMYAGRGMDAEAVSVGRRILEMPVNPKSRAMQDLRREVSREMERLGGSGPGAEDQ